MFKKGNKYRLGQAPWNKDMKGIHLNPATEFKKGHPAPKTAFKKGQPSWNKDKKIQTNTGKTHFKKGNAGYWKGKNRPKETLRKISETLKKNPIRHWLGKEFSDEHRLKLSRAKGGNGKREPYSFDWTYTLKEAIRQRDNYKCQMCGCPQEECIRKLDVHHIDYDKKNCDPKNLLSLCMNCHRKTFKNRKHWARCLKN